MPNEASHGRYCLHVRLQVRAERRDEFLECIQANQRGTLTTEPLALAYLFGEDETSTNTFHFFEAYKGRAGFEAHTQTQLIVMAVSFHSLAKFVPRQRREWGAVCSTVY